MWEAVFNLPPPTHPSNPSLEDAINGAIQALLGAPDGECRALAWRLFLELRGRRSPNHIAHLEAERLTRVLRR
jgi:hypothetical protein